MSTKVFTNAMTVNGRCKSESAIATVANISRLIESCPPFNLCNNEHVVEGRNSYIVTTRVFYLLGLRKFEKPAERSPCSNRLLSGLSILQDLVKVEEDPNDILLPIIINLLTEH